MSIFLKNNNTILVMFLNNKLIGFSSLKKIAGTKNITFWMDYFFIKEGYHNKGLGLKLLKYIDIYIKKKYLNENLINGTIIGGTSSLQLKFWKKYSSKVIATDFYYKNYKVPKKILSIMPIKSLKVMFDIIKWNKYI